MRLGPRQLLRIGIVVTLMLASAGCQCIKPGPRLEARGVVEEPKHENPETTAFWSVVGTALEFIGPWLSCR